MTEWHNKVGSDFDNLSVSVKLFVLGLLYDLHFCIPIPMVTLHLYYMHYLYPQYTYIQWPLVHALHLTTVAHI